MHLERIWKRFNSIQEIADLEAGVEFEASIDPDAGGAPEGTDLHFD